jgi:hypothetical protein
MIALERAVVHRRTETDVNDRLDETEERQLRAGTRVSSSRAAVLCARRPRTNSAAGGGPFITSHGRQSNVTGLYECASLDGASVAGGSVASLSGTTATR